MDVRQLRAFVAVARELSFRKAAESLYVSQATVSETIRSLEQELGGQLFLRTSRRVELTEAGRQFEAEAADIVRRIDLLSSRTRDALGPNPQTVTVGEPLAADDEVLSAITDAVERATARVVRPVELNTAAGVAALRAGDIDLAVVLLPLTPEERAAVTTVVAATAPLGILVPPGHRLHRVAALAPGDLAGEEVLSFPRASAPGYWDHVAAGLRSAHPGVRLGDSLATRAQARTAARRHLVVVTEARRERVATVDLRWHPLTGTGLCKTTGLAARVDDRRPWVLAALGAVAAGAPALAPAT